MIPAALKLSVGARAVRALTVLRRRTGAFPGRDQSTAFLGPEPTGEAARHFHVRDKRKLTSRLREFFVFSPALGRTVGVRVLLPGRPSESAPVLWLLHGSGDDFRSWTDFGDAEALTADSPHLVVMPDAGAASYSRHAVHGTRDTGRGTRVDSDDEVLDWPAFHLEELSAFIADTFSVRPDRIDSAIAGLSMGGYGAMKYAALHPDRFAAAAAFSSPLDPASAVPLFDIIALRQGGAARSLFGDPKHDRAEWDANSPVALAANLRHTDLWFSAGSGTPDPDTEDAVDLLETEVAAHGARFHTALERLGIPHVWCPRPTGVHNWALWRRELAEWLAHIDASPDAVDDPYADGASFDHVTGEPAFSVHGWTVSLSRRRAQLTQFRDVSGQGFTLTGSGTFRVQTADVFHPGEKYRVTVSSPLTDTSYTLCADADGRLEITGRMAGAMHDPIIPGRRTRHFREFGADAVTRVAIAAHVSDGTSTAQMGGAMQENTTTAEAPTSPVVREQNSAPAGSPLENLKF
ncbi:MAG: alpha/beta hydrolase [Brevibacterium yomogidense]